MGAGVLVPLSRLLRSTGLLLPLFSWPGRAMVEENGDAFPASGAWLKTRLMGLLGEVRVRGERREGGSFARDDDRSANLALGGNGTARGDGVCGGWGTDSEDASCEGDSEGEKGDFGEELGDLVMMRNFEGDLESERLSDLTADVTST